MSATPPEVPLLSEHLARAVAEARARERISARALALKCEAIGVSAIDRQRIANLEAGRGRPLAVDEWLALSLALGLRPLDLLTARPVGEDEAAEQRWVSRQVRLAEALSLNLDWLDAWIAGEAPAPTGEEDDWTPPPPPPVTAEHAMELVADLAARHGLRVTFEQVDRG